MKKATFLIFLFLSQTIFGQSISIYDIDTTSFPVMKAKFFAFDAAGKQIKNLTTSDLTVLENNLDRKITSVFCPDSPEPAVLSLAISIDISGSMTTGEGGVPSVELGKTTARNLVNALTMPPNEVAIQTCHAIAFIKRDFTTNKSNVIETINTIQAGGDNNFVEHLLNPRTGILNVAKTGSHKRVAILCTDAWWYPLSPNQLQSAIDTCKKYGITFYSIIFNRKQTEPNGIKVSLKAISDATGGKMYDGAITQDAAKELAALLGASIMSDNPCKIEWLSEAACKSELRTVEIKLTKLFVSASSQYNLPFNSLYLLNIEPSSVRFTGLPINKQKDTIITVTAKNRDIDILDIIASDQKYTISPRAFNLKKGESRQLTISVTPDDSAYSFCRMQIKSSACENYLYCSNVYGHKPILNPSIKLTFPDGGEKFLVGADSVVKWEGLLPEDTVALDYSTDNGATWINVSKNATGLIYDWKNIPKPPAKNCLMKVRKTNMPQDFVGTSHTSDVNSVAFSPDGLFAVSGSEDNDVIIWETNTAKPYRTLKGHTGSIYNLIYNKNSTRLFSGGWDNNIIMWDNNGKQLKSFNRDPAFYTAFTINPDGSLLYCGMMDNSISVFNVSDSKEIMSLTGHSSYINSLAVNSDNSLLASGSSDNKVIVWDLNKGVILKTLTRHKYPVTSVSFSPDNQTLASGSSDKTVLICNAKTGAVLKTINCPWEVNSVAFCPDGTKVACSGTGTEVNIYDIISGDLTKTLKGHTDDVLSVAYNYDGSMLVSGSSDKSVRFWGLEGNLQSDVSDSVWAIVKPEIRGMDADLGKVTVGNHKDSAISNYFYNKTAFNSQVKATNIKGTNADEFKMISDAAPFVIEANSQKAVEFHFEPKSIGIKNAIIEIITADTVQLYKLTGEGIEQQLQLQSSIIDFGKHRTGSRKDTLIIALKNTSSISVNVTNTKMMGPDTSQYFILSGGGNFVLSAGATHEMSLSFRPVIAGRSSGSIGFDYSGPESPQILQLFGEGLKGAAPKITSNSPLCEGDDLHLFADSSENASFHWFGPDNFISNEQNPIIRNIKPSNTGRYFVYNKFGEIISDTAYLDVYVSTQLVSPGDSSFIFVGSAIKTKDYIRLTKSLPWDGGSIWLKNRFSVKKDFETTFQFRYRDGKNETVSDGFLPGADGIAFVMQNHNYPFLGDKGGAMGYKGITYSLAIEVDLWKNFYDPNGNHIAVQSLGTEGNQPDHSIPGINLAMNKDIITLKQDSIYYIKISYEWSKKTLKVFLDTNEKESTEVINIDNIDLADYLKLEEGEYVYIGFTSGTGDSYEEHQIMNWTIPCRNQLLDAEETYYSHESDDITVFPNPASNIISISCGFPFESVSNIELIDVFGKSRPAIVNSVSHINQGAKFAIDLNAFADGVYILQIKANDTKYSKKILIIK